MCSGRRSRGVGAVRVLGNCGRQAKRVRGGSGAHLAGVATVRHLRAVFLSAPRLCFVVLGLLLQPEMPWLLCLRFCAGQVQAFTNPNALDLVNNLKSLVLVSVIGIDVEDFSESSRAAKVNACVMSIVDVGEMYRDAWH